LEYIPVLRPVQPARNIPVWVHVGPFNPRSSAQGCFEFVGQRFAFWRLCGALSEHAFNEFQHSTSLTQQSTGEKMKRIIAAALVACIAVPAMAQPRNCGEREKIVAALAEKYQEPRQSIGIAANNSVMEVFANTESGTWTIAVTLPNGLTCIVADGQAFESLNEALPPDGDDA
jgi:hypothetical protein